MCVGLTVYDQGGGIKDSKGRNEANIMQDGSITCSMGLEWMGIRIHVFKATTPIRIYMLNYCILYSFSNTVYFSPLLDRVKINHMKSYECAVNLESVSMATNINNTL